MPLRKPGFIGVIASLLAAAPSFAAAPFSLHAYRGQVVYLDFWASWCGPCKQSFPWMESLQDAYAARGLRVVAIDLDRHKSDADRFLTQFHPDFDVIFDPNGSLAERFRIHGMPTSMLIDRHGTVRFTHIGFRPADAAAYEKQVQVLLAEK